MNIRSGTVATCVRSTAWSMTQRGCANGSRNARPNKERLTRTARLVWTNDGSKLFDQTLIYYAGCVSSGEFDLTATILRSWSSNASVIDFYIADSLLARCWINRILLFCFSLYVCFTNSIVSRASVFSFPLVPQTITTRRAGEQTANHPADPAASRHAFVPFERSSEPIIRPVSGLRKEERGV